MSYFPRVKLLKLLEITIEVISGVLGNPNLLKIIQTKQTEGQADQQIDAYFLELVLR